MKKVGRNDPCPCGSGKKYKHCCLPLDTSSGIIRLVPDQPEAQTPAHSEAVLESLINNAPWQNPQYQAVAREAARQMKGSYELHMIENGLKLWLAYSAKEQPQIRKPGVMEAAVEYTVATMYGLTEITQSQLAEKYNVSPGTISQRAQKLLEIAQGYDTSAPAGETEREAAEPDPFSVERAVRDLTKQLEANKFETIQEAQAYLNELLYGDKSSPDKDKQ